MRYAAVWLGAGAAIALVVILLGGPARREEAPVLPAVRETHLDEAAQAARCDLRRRAGEAANPPVTGPRGAPARPAAYDRAPSTTSLVGALRRGIIVVQYREGLGGEQLEQLDAIRRGVPGGTILTPNATRMPFAVAATAYGRLLGCRAFTERTVDALRLFRGRYLGQGPDR